MLEAHEEWHQLADISMNLGVLYGRLDKYDKALEQLGIAQSLYLASKSPNRFLIELSRADILRNLGRFEEAVQASQIAWHGFLSAGQTMEAARSQEALATTYFVLGRYNEALELLEKAKESFATDNRFDDVAIAELQMSDYFIEHRRFKEAIAHCIKAREHFKKIGSQYEVAQTYLNEAMAHTHLKQHTDALTALNEAHRLFEIEKMSFGWRQPTWRWREHYAAKKSLKRHRK
ncbi:MAG: tetratricopeptide repeat protein [Anaerolineae bacterium]|nr:tetratricopeptide repeat protein [Anaerolineae bacterium]